ncbi:MAG: glycosyltransferase [Ancalomicrobiaceae bacterium]|nr:glycosyltransferase [Ancalomicrobiaceae bacterium]
MRICLIHTARLPVFAYGGTERVVWDLGTALHRLGHSVTLLAGEGTVSEFARVIEIDKQRPLKEQIPRDVDVVHFQGVHGFDPDTEFDLPYVMTEHGNAFGGQLNRYLNSLFLSKNHAARHNCDQYVYNGLDWDAYGPVDLARSRPHCHFLGKASWNVKNIHGAINVAREAKVTMDVLGGSRLNLSRGFRLTFSPRIRFHGMVGGKEKFALLNGSRGHIFPVRWHEPFGLAMIESLYFGAPVYGTPYGTLPELVVADVGFLSASRHELAMALKDMRFDPKRCHEYARDEFNATRMAKAYLEKYEWVASGRKLNATGPYLSDRSTDPLPWDD